jgi:hypothetical protein
MTVLSAVSDRRARAELRVIKFIIVPCGKKECAEGSARMH